MSGRTARAYRKKVYGVDGSHLFRKYRRHNTTGAIVTDEKRQSYQREKGRKKWDTV